MHTSRDVISSNFWVNLDTSILKPIGLRTHVSILADKLIDTTVCFPNDSNDIVSHVIMDLTTTYELANLSSINLESGHSKEFRSNLRTLDDIVAKVYNKLLPKTITLILNHSGKRVMLRSALSGGLKRLQSHILKQYLRLNRLRPPDQDEYSKWKTSNINLILFQSSDNDKDLPWGNKASYSEFRIFESLKSLAIGGRPLLT